MVDFSGKAHDNVLDFSARLDAQMARNMPLADDDRSPFARPAYEYLGRERNASWTSVIPAFRWQALDHEDKVLLKIVGFSTIMTCLIMGTAFSSAMAIVWILRFF